MNEREFSTMPISALFPVFDNGLVDRSANIQTNTPNNQSLKCSTCNRCLQELFRQGCYLLFGDLKQQSNFNFARLPNNINEGRLLEKLCLPDHPQIGTDGFCKVCDTRVIQLKIEAARAIRNLKRQNHLAHIQTSHWQTLINRQIQCHSQDQSGNTLHSNSSNRIPLFDRLPRDNIQQPRYPFEIVPCSQLKNNPYRITINNNKFHQVDYSKPFHWAIRNNLASTEQKKMINNNKPTKFNQIISTPSKDIVKDEIEPTSNIIKETSSSSQSNLAAAASFFAKAGKKPLATGNELTASFKKKKKQEHAKIKESDFLTCFSEILKTSPPPVPPTLLKTSANRPLGYNAGKIKVIIRLKYLETSKPENYQNMSPSQTCISVDSTKKQITVFESQSATSTPRRMNTNIPKIYVFDAVYTDDDDPTELCSNALTDIIQSVVSGIDGCVFSFGHLRSSSNLTMIGSDQQIRKLGLIPCAISWLFRLICEQKEKTGARFSVRVSAIEVHGKQEILKDLLSDIEVIENVGQCSPGVYLRDDPVSGTQLQNQSELRAPTAEKAAYYLDAALAARTMSFNEEDSRLSHFLFTLHVYQYRVERGTTGSAVAGGRSRLHMLDFGSGRILQPFETNFKETTPNEQIKPEFQFNSTALSLSATAAVLLALVNGQRHIPYRTSKLSQLLREAMSSLSCRTCMVAHIAMNTTHCADSMQIIQFASKLQRLKRRKFSKLSGTSSDDSSSCDSFGFRRASRHKGGKAGFSSGSSNNGMTSSEADYTSSSEQSCDTVIYLGASRNKIGEEQSSFLLRKRRISAPSFTNTILERSGSESDLLKLDISKYHINSHHYPKASVRTNALVWPKVAAKNAIETLSTQKEMWVDGPMVSNKIKNQLTEASGNLSKFVNTETQSYLKEPNSPSKENHSKQRHMQDVTSEIDIISQFPDVNSNNQETTIINSISVTSTNSTSIGNPSSQESITAAVGSSDGDQKLFDVCVTSSLPINSLSNPPHYIHSIINASSPLPNIISETTSTSHSIVTPQAYKPFVWDWVEKHSDMIVDSPNINPSDNYPFQTDSTDDVQSPHKRSAKHCAKHQQMMKKPKPCITNEQITENNERESRKRHKSSKHKAAQTHLTNDNYKINQFNNPSVEPNFTRVAEWVRSVSEETSRAQSLSPVRRNNTVKDIKTNLVNNENIPSNSSLQMTVNYRSLDRHAQGYLNMSQTTNYSNIYMDSADLSQSSIRFSCVPAGSRTFDSIPLPSNQYYQHDIVTSKRTQVISKNTSQNMNLESQQMHTPLKKVNSQNDDMIPGVNGQQKSQNHMSKQSNKNSPTKQVLERSSPNKTRSSSLIKNALFGRCKLSSSNNIDESNQYSVPNSPCKNKSLKNCNKPTRDFASLNNTGGYHYVIMTSSLSTPAKNLQDENAKIIKRRSSSTSPGKSSGSSTDKKQLANSNRREKIKEKNKENKVENKIKIKKESKKKLSFLTSPLFGKKKEKDKCLTTAISKQSKPIKPIAQSQVCSIHHGQENSSKVISPYCTVTQPKHSTHSSSGHGSDCSSVYGQQHKFAELAGHIKCRECTNIDEEGSCLNHIDQCNIDQHQLLRRSQRRGGGHTSSGYESIMRDSEVSSQNDSTSESSLGAPPRPQTPEKQQSQSSSSSSKQSRSAPNRSEETSEDTQSPVSVRKMSPKPTFKNQINDQLKKENEIKKIAKQIQFEKIYDLLAQQDMLKTELLQSKERILVDPTSWSYDLHVVEQMDPEDTSFIEALEKETDILRRRVEACKSHVLLITYFDIKYRNPILPEVKGQSMNNNKKTSVISTAVECNSTDPSYKHLKS